MRNDAFVVPYSLASVSARVRWKTLQRLLPLFNIICQFSVSRAAAWVSQVQLDFISFTKRLLTKLNGRRRSIEVLN